MLNVDNSGCSNSDGDSAFGFEDDSDNHVLRLLGTLYLYLVSPDPFLLINMENSTIDKLQRSYLHHILDAYSFSIDLNKLSSYSAVSDNIDMDSITSMLGSTIYGVSYDDIEQVLKIDLLCWSPSYMVYVLEEGEYGFQWLLTMDANVSFVGLESIDILTVSNGRIFQKFRVSLKIIDCDAEAGGVSLDNLYLLWMTSAPRSDSDDDVQDWMDTIGATSPNDTITLFFDVLDFEYYESCESFSFVLEFDENITFYEDNSYSGDALITSSNPLFVSNSGTDQRLYVEINLVSSIAGDLTESNIIDLTILDVWFCVYNNNDTNLTDSCFEGGSASASSSVEIWYLYSTTSGTTDDGYMTNSDIISDSSDNLIEQFSFIIPIISNTDANRFGVQIGIELSIVDSSASTPTTTTVRRVRARTLLDEDEEGESRYNYVDQSYRSNSMTLTDDGDDNGGGSDNNNNNNPFGNNASFYYIIFACCGLLIAALCVIVYLMVERKRKSNEVVTKHMQSIEIGVTGVDADIPIGAPRTHENPDGAANGGADGTVDGTADVAANGGVDDLDELGDIDTDGDGDIIVTKQESIPF